jgi:AhpD family alkylhydroperoxidase
MKNPVALLPGALDALYSLGVATRDSGVSARIVGLVQMRTSQINGCVVTMDSHIRMLREAGETSDRLASLWNWSDSDLFTDAERSALALCEAVSRSADQDDPVPDEIWNEAAEHYDQTSLAGLLLAIATANLWNRLNVATRQVVDAWDTT